MNNEPAKPDRVLTLIDLRGEVSTLIADPANVDLVDALDGLWSRISDQIGVLMDAERAERRAREATPAGPTPCCDADEQAPCVGCSTPSLTGESRGKAGVDLGPADPADEDSFADQMAEVFRLDPLDYHEAEVSEIGTNLGMPEWN